MAGGFDRGPRRMDSPAYSIRIKTETGGKTADEQAWRRRKTLVISALCCTVVLLLGGLAGGLRYYDMLGRMTDSERPRTSLDASSIVSSQRGSAETKRTIYGSDQAPVSGEDGIQTRVDGLTSGDNAGTAQVGDGSVVGRFRLFYANNRRAVLVAIMVSVFVVVAVIAAVTAAILLQQQAANRAAASTDSGDPGAIIHPPDAAPTINIPLVVGLVILFSILAAISVYYMSKEKDLRPRNPAQVFFHFIFFTLFISPFALVCIAVDISENTKCSPPMLKRVLNATLTAIAFPLAVFGIITSVIWRFLPVIVSEPFKEKVLRALQMDNLASDFAKYVKGLFTSASH